MPETVATQTAAEPGVGSVHVPTAMGAKPSKAKKPLNTHFLKRMMVSMMERYSEDELAEMRKKAACHAGGMTKAEKAKMACMQNELYKEVEGDNLDEDEDDDDEEQGKTDTKIAKEAAADESLTARLNEIQTAFREWAKKPNTKPGEWPDTEYYSREVFDDYVIAECTADGELYKVPYSQGIAGGINFGLPVKVVTKYVPVNASEVADLCTDGHGWRLFVEHEFAEAPDWMPLLPKPGNYQHPKYGPIKLSKTRNASFADGVNKNIYQSSLPVNTEHASGTDGAHGWIEEARLNEDGSVDARVSWTDIGKEAIAKDRFRFISPEWADECVLPDGKTIKDVIRGAALTVRPFFKDKQLRPLVASERGWEVCDTAPASDEPQQYFFFTALQPSAPGSEPGTQSFKEPTPMADTNKNKDEQVPPVEKPVVQAAEPPAVSAQEFAEMKTRQEALELENKQFKEAAEAQAAEVKKLSEDNASLKDSAETKRFTEEVEGKSKENKHAYVGDFTEHVAHMKSLAKAFGEDSAEFKHYLKTQRQAAVITEQSLAFRELGKSGVEAETTPYGKLCALANEARTKNPALTFEQAFSEVMGQPEHKELYQQYTEQGN